MTQTNINIRMDEDLKLKFDALCGRMGLTMTAAFNVFAKAVVRQQGIPFEVTAKEDHFYSETNQKRLLAAMKRMEETGGTPHELIEVEGD
ncbi:MAG: type II toxin-antitoxin system RelB/DinJ family antitoxin [Candidatus Adiutrix sp.]|jgi:DNA-damage-inducible protein J|nr:type II toxin-antitoxin system RelB/DinJ family antitoxin [Candidatus Adiutrix sp.]